jgi:hypothetical protein
MISNMKVWILLNELDGYLNLGYINEDDADQFVFGFKGMEMKECWEPVHLNTYEEGRWSDIPWNTPPIFSQKAVDALKGLLEGRAEILPLIHSEAQYYAINVINVLDCFDYEKGKVEKDEEYDVIKDIKKYAFKFDKLQDDTIFKIPERKKSVIFITDTFKQRVEESGLAGFRFVEVWDSEANVTEVDEQDGNPPKLQPIQENPLTFNEAWEEVKSKDVVVAATGGEWKLKKHHNGEVIVGKWEYGKYTWMEPIYVPPIFLELEWYIVSKE